jgi:F0F1-type ATP synthase assembly protein I
MQGLCASFRSFRAGQWGIDPTADPHVSIGKFFNRQRHACIAQLLTHLFRSEASISLKFISNRWSLTMKASWASILGALEGAGLAALVSGLLVGILGWHLDSIPKISAFLAVMLLGAVAGWSIGAKVAHRRAARLATQVSST